jgi:hypothetical protein
MEKPRDVKRFAAVMMALAECFDKELSEYKLEVFFESLRELSIEEVEAAARWLMRHRTITGTFPVIAEFFQALEKVQADNLDLADRAELAWRKLVWAIENYGYYQSVSFDDAILHAAIEALGGWLKITDGENRDWYESQLQWRKKEFVQIYQALARKNSPLPESRRYFPGLFELENGPEMQPPVMRISGEAGRYKARPIKQPGALPASPSRPEQIRLVNRKKLVG